MALIDAVGRTQLTPGTTIVPDDTSRFYVKSASAGVDGYITMADLAAAYRARAAAKQGVTVADDLVAGAGDLTGNRTKLQAYATVGGVVLYPRGTFNYAPLTSGTTMTMTGTKWVASAGPGSTTIVASGVSGGAAYAYHVRFGNDTGWDGINYTNAVTSGVTVSNGIVPLSLDGSRIRLKNGTYNGGTTDSAGVISCVVLGLSLDTAVASLDDIYGADLTLTGFSYAIFQSNTNTSTKTNLMFERVLCELNYYEDFSPNAPNGTITGFTLRSCRARDGRTYYLTGAAINNGHLPISGASVKDFHVDDCRVWIIDIGNHQTQGMHFEENCSGLRVTNSYVYMDGQGAGVAIGCFLLANSFGGAVTSPSGEVLGLTVVRTGTPGGYGLTLSEASDGPTAMRVSHCEFRGAFTIAITVGGQFLSRVGGATVNHNSITHNYITGATKGISIVDQGVGCRFNTTHNCGIHVETKSATFSDNIFAGTGVQYDPVASGKAINPRGLSGGVSGTYAISAITQAASAVFTVPAGHQVQAGNTIVVWTVAGMTAINASHTVTAVGPTSITVSTNSSGYGAYTSGGTLAVTSGTINRSIFNWSATRAIAGRMELTIRAPYVDAGITAISLAASMVVTVNANPGFIIGQLLNIYNIGVGTTQANGNHTVTAINGNQITTSTNSSGFTAYVPDNTAGFRGILCQAGNTQHVSVEVEGTGTAVALRSPSSGYSVTNGLFSALGLNATTTDLRVAVTIATPAIGVNLEWELVGSIFAPD